MGPLFFKLLPEDLQNHYFGRYLVYRLLTILCLLLPSVAQSIPIKVPTLLSAGEENLDLSVIEPYSGTPFAELIAEQHDKNTTYLLARVVTQDQNTKFYIHYFDAQALCQNLNVFTTQIEERDEEGKPTGYFIGGRKISPPELITRNVVLYNNDISHLPQRFAVDPTNRLPITLEIHYFELAKDASAFTYLCSHEDLLIERRNKHYRNYWRSYFQANLNLDTATIEGTRKAEKWATHEGDKKRVEELHKQLQELETTYKAELQAQNEGINYLKKHPQRPVLRQNNPYATKTSDTAITITLPHELGANEYLDPQHQDSITHQSFAQLMRSTTKGDLSIIVRFVYQDNEGNYTVSYCDAHAFNTTYFGGYPLPQNTANALLYLGNLPSLSNAPETKYFYTVQEQGRGILNRNILYFAYDPSTPKLGCIFLCSHFDLFISEKNNRDYWETVLEANQNYNEKLKKQALVRLQTTAFQKKTKEFNEARKKVAAQQAAAEAWQAQVRKAAQAAEEDALSVLGEEVFAPLKAVILENALTRLYEQLALLTHTLTEKS